MLFLSSFVCTCALSCARAAREWISSRSRWAATDGTTDPHLTQRIDSARSVARIDALAAGAHCITAAFAITAFDQIFHGMYIFLFVSIIANNDDYEMQST